MNKGHFKKAVSLEETPVILPQRRATFAETSLDAAAGLDATVARPRSSSSSDAAVRVVQRSQSVTGSADSKKSNFSSVSGLIVTESELSASLLYKDIKAKNNATGITRRDSVQSRTPKFETMNPTDLQNHHEFNSIAQDDLKTSCCCCTTVVFIICICSFGILSAIGGIIYMELVPRLKNSPGESHVSNPPVGGFNRKAFIESATLDSSNISKNSFDVGIDAFVKALAGEKSDRQFRGGILPDSSASSVDTGATESVPEDFTDLGDSSTGPSSMEDVDQDERQSTEMPIVPPETKDEEIMNNSPVISANIAMPVELLRRLGILEGDQKSVTPLVNRKMSMKSTLSDALEPLQNVESVDPLPEGLNKSDPAIDVDAERSAYLDKLRLQMAEE